TSFAAGESVKPGSRLASVALFTIAALVAAASPSVARADRVVLYPVAGRAAAERADELEDRLAEVIRALGHEVVAPPGGLGTSRPDTAAAMGGVASASGATYVVLPEVEPLRGQYRLQLVVG